MLHNPTPLLLGDQLENSIRVCTQTIGNYFGFTGKKLSLTSKGPKDLPELCLLSSPFLYYIKQSGMPVDSIIPKELASKISSFQTTDGAFGNSHKSWQSRSGSKIETSLAVLALIQLHETGQVDTRGSLADALQWLHKSLHRLESKGETILLDELFSSYALLKAKQIFNFSKSFPEVTSLLKQLASASENLKIVCEHSLIPKELWSLFAVRLILEMGIAGKHEGFCKLAYSLTESQQKRISQIEDRLYGAPKRERREVTVSIEEISLLSYNLIQLHSYFHIPRYYEQSAMLLRFISEIVIYEAKPSKLLFPEIFSLKTRSLVASSRGLWALRFYLDVAEDAKRYYASSVPQIAYSRQSGAPA